MYSPLEQFDIYTLKFSNWYILDISMVSIILPLFLVNFLIVNYIYLTKNKYKLIPEAWQYVFEKLYEFIYFIIKQQVGSKGFVYMPLVLTLFLFVLLCNLISLVPFGIALTSHLILILFLSITLCVSIFSIGVIKHNVNFFKNFIPECPFILVPILIPIEIFSYLIRMFSLAIRLAANILAGHTLVYIISGFILKTCSLKSWFYIIVMLPLLAILVLEFGVAFLQAYVFVILVCIYLNDTLKSAGH